MASPLAIRLDDESEAILNSICNERNLSKSEAIRFALKNTDSGFEIEKLKKLEEQQKKLFEIFETVSDQNNKVLSAVSNRVTNDEQSSSIVDTENGINNDVLKVLGTIIRHSQSIQMIRDIQKALPDFYEYHVKLS